MMNAKIKERKRDMEWLNISRKFYKGLYEALNDPEHLKRYYQDMHMHINHRSEWDKQRGH